MNAIANATRAAVGDDFTTTSEQMRNYYEHPSDFDPARDVAVVELDGRIVGYVRGGIHQEVAGPADLRGPSVPRSGRLADRACCRSCWRRWRITSGSWRPRIRPGDKVFETFGGDFGAGARGDHPAGPGTRRSGTATRWFARHSTTCPTRRSCRASRSGRSAPSTCERSGTPPPKPSATNGAPASRPTRTTSAT